MSTVRESLVNQEKSSWYQVSGITYGKGCAQDNQLTINGEKTQTDAVWLQLTDSEAIDLKKNLYNLDIASKTKVYAKRFFGTLAVMVTGLFGIVAACAFYSEASSIPRTNLTNNEDVKEQLKNINNLYGLPQPKKTGSLRYVNSNKGPFSIGGLKRITKAESEALKKSGHVVNSVAVGILKMIGYGMMMVAWALLNIVTFCVPALMLSGARGTETAGAGVGM